MLRAANPGETTTLLPPQKVFLILVLIGAVQFTTFLLLAIFQSDTQNISGDFVAFWAAGHEVFAGRLSELYAADGLKDAIATHRPEAPEETARLTWQYPPHSTLIFGFVAILPFYPAYVVWSVLGLSAFAFAFKRLDVGTKPLLAIMVSPLVFAAIITGQNGLFTAALLILSITWIDKRPILAGLSAAALTLKPQIGLLLPIAYLAGRAWAPFLSAAIGSLVLWGASLLIADKDSWLSFFDSVTNVSGSVESGLMPLFKMVTIFSASRLVGLPSEVAVGLSLVAAIILMGMVAWVWQKTRDTELRLASISAAALLIAPYGFYYELTIAVPALFIVARRGYMTGWLPLEQIAIACLILISIGLPGPAIREGVSISFLFLAGVTLLTYRRIFAELFQTTHKDTGHSRAPCLKAGLS